MLICEERFNSLKLGFRELWSLLVVTYQICLKAFWKMPFPPVLSRHHQFKVLHHMWDKIWEMIGKKERSCEQMQGKLQNKKKHLKETLRKLEFTLKTLLDFPVSFVCFWKSCGTKWPLTHLSSKVQDSREIGKVAMIDTINLSRTFQREPIDDALRREGRLSSLLLTIVLTNHRNRPH